jgi:Zn-dependent protease
MFPVTGKRYLLLWLAIPAAAVMVYPYVKDTPSALKWFATALSLVVLFFSIVIHEVSHGLASLAGGDATALNAKRLTLNPVEHVSIVGSILLPLLLFLTKAPGILGWAKPVPLNPMNLRVYPRDQIFSVLAGPLSNFGLAYLSFVGFVVAGAVFKLINPEATVPVMIDFSVTEKIDAVSLQGFWFVVFRVFSMGIIINISLAVFNLVPFPPLDGYWLLKAIFPPKITSILTKIQPWGFVLIIIALQTKLFILFLYPIIALGGLSIWLLRLLLE